MHAQWRRRYICYHKSCSSFVGTSQDSAVICEDPAPDCNSRRVTPLDRVVAHTIQLLFSGGSHVGCSFLSCIDSREDIRFLFARSFSTEHSLKYLPRSFFSFIYTRSLV